MKPTNISWEQFFAMCGHFLKLSFHFKDSVFGALVRELWGERQENGFEDRNKKRVLREKESLTGKRNP